MRSLLLLLAAAGALAAENRDAVFSQSIAQMFPKLVEIRRDIHSHPELPNEEVRTAKLVADRLKELGFTDIRTGVAGTGVVAMLKGAQDGPCVAVRADMDALPIKELRSTPYRSKNPGVMHACGHDVHVTCALGVAELLAKHKDHVKGSVKFIFQPAEEAMPATFKGDWGAKLMVAQGVLEDPRPAAIFGLHTTASVQPASTTDEVTQYLKAGQIGYTAGVDNANSDRFRIVIKGRMAHGSTPHKGVDAIAVAAEAVMALQMIKSRQTNTRQPLVISIGLIKGGDRENIIAERVEMGGTVRTFDSKFRDGVIEQMHRVLKGITAAHGAEYEMEYRKTYPRIENDRALVEATLSAFRRVCGEKNVIEFSPGMGGEDFSYYAQVVPGFFFRLGVANEEKGFIHGGHTPMYDCDEESIKTGVAAMAAAVCDFLDRVRP
ncbi:MAG: amidohydrolase [Prosthecobacter sp.]|jgi:amidohydrolase|uniref:M20 metallopeptidase family protein n=1 Tax=Prosthecobacter sp. TaxID=1965333 RepID=UPI0019F4AE62|nr:amidohydrolase [Prosthecobacter sp.]MBE2283491.1 amidohydrolase [Prosthecobacter sp.]